MANPKSNQHRLKNRNHKKTKEETALFWRFAEHKFAGTCRPANANSHTHARKKKARRTSDAHKKRRSVT
jgi:hypothetical protein